SPFAGRIVSLHGAQDDDVPVGAPLVTFEVEGADGPVLAGDRPAPHDPDVPDTRSSSPSPEPGPVGATIAATPPVRKPAKELGVDIETVTGSGPNGRVTEADVRRVADAPGAATAGTVRNDLRVEPLPTDPIRASIAATLTEQMRIPQVTTFRTLDASA